MGVRLQSLCRSERPHPRPDLCVEFGFNSCREEKPSFIEREMREASSQITGNVGWTRREEVGKGRGTLPV